MNTLQEKTARPTDWEKINAEAFAHSLIPVALPQRDGIPFWNANARQFIMPPAFEAPPLPGASSYRFTLKDREGKELAAFDSASPQDPLTPVWGRIPVGDVQLSIEALDEQGKSMQQVFQRNFYRCAWFHGPYPSISHDYRKAAMRALAYLYNLPHVQGWLAGGTVDEKVYRKYCYPSKTLSAIIRGLNLYADHVDDPEVKKKALTISRYMADWLIDNSCPAGSPMEYIPPTYWKHAAYHLAKPNIGQVMMTYPTMVGNAYLTIYRRTQDRHYLDAALRLGNTMKKLELPSGSWPLKMREADGKPTVENVVLITGDMILFFTQLAELSGDESFAQLRDRAYQRLLDHNLKLWDWDGQFEDVIPYQKPRALPRRRPAAERGRGNRTADCRLERGSVRGMERSQPGTGGQHVPRRQAVRIHDHAGGAGAIQLLLAGGRLHLQLHLHLEQGIPNHRGSALSGESQGDGRLNPAQPASGRLHPHLVFQHRPPGLAQLHGLHGGNAVGNRGNHRVTFA